MVICSVIWELFDFGMGESMVVFYKFIGVFMIDFVMDVVVMFFLIGF